MNRHRSLATAQHRRAPPCTDAGLTATDDPPDRGWPALLDERQLLLDTLLDARLRDTAGVARRLQQGCGALGQWQLAELAGQIASAAACGDGGGCSRLVGRWLCAWAQANPGGLPGEAARPH